MAGEFLEAAQGAHRVEVIVQDRDLHRLPLRRT
jgi:hypothetical protein